MNAVNCTVRDSATMLRRQLRHMLRYPSLTVIVVGMPVVFLLLFVYVLGGTMGSGRRWGIFSRSPDRKSTRSRSAPCMPASLNRGISASALLEKPFSTLKYACSTSTAA